MVTNNAINNSIKITSYDTPGTFTWTKDTRTQMITVIAWAGGAGGGSGRRGASTQAGGGGGGGAGGVIFVTYPASMFNNTETVIVGTGGIGGIPQTVNNTDGISPPPPSVTEQSSFGYLVANSNSTPNGGTVGGAGGGQGQSCLINGVMVSYNSLSPGSAGAGANTNGADGRPIGVKTGTNPYCLLVGGGGGGGGGANNGFFLNGGNGASIYDLNSTLLFSGGSGGIESGTIDGGNGITPGFTGNTHGLFLGGTGGGGGGGQKAGAVAGNGGKGGFPGGGGGGGGGSLNGTNSGAGGAGADGLVMVIEYFK